MFLEEIDEEPYAIDRLLTQMDQSGILGSIKGIILGNFKRCIPEEPEKSFTLNETLNQKLGHLKIPVMMGGDFGHTLNKWTVPIGIRARINTTPFQVELLENTVT